MGNIHNPTDNIRIDVAMNQATLNNSANTPTYLSMANYDLIWFLVLTSTRTGAASLTLQQRQRIGAAGAQANLKTSTTLATADSETEMLEVDCLLVSVSSQHYDHIGASMISQV